MNKGYNNINMDDLRHKLALRFGNTIEKDSIEGNNDMLSVGCVFGGNKPFVPEGYQVNFHEPGYLILSETLIDHFFEIFNEKLIYDKKNINDMFDRVFLFCQKNKIDLQLKQKDNQSIHGHINGNVIYVTYPSNVTKKEFIYTVLHELSHYITNKSSGNKLKQFIKAPLSHSVNITNVDDLLTELNYYLTPAELSNWVFTLSLYMFEEKYKSASVFYKVLKDNISTIQPDLIFSTQFYKDLSPGLQPLYHLIVYVRQLKEFDLPHNQRIKYRNKLMFLIKILDKYVKRLNKLFL